MPYLHEKRRGTVWSQLSLYIKPYAKRQLDEIAKENNVSTAQLVRDIIDRYLFEKNTKTKLKSGDEEGSGLEIEDDIMW